MLENLSKAQIVVDRFKNFRSGSTRLQKWDYGWNASYFVTICTAEKEYYFGDVVNGKMKLSEIGKIARKFWLAIPNHFPFVKLDAYVVMPNHVHGIIVIDKPDDGRYGERNMVVVETQDLASLQKQQPQNQFGPQSRNLASIIRGYKIGVTKYARNHEIDFAWQPRYYDHIIRNKSSYQQIKNYIINNPENWIEDEFFK